MEREGCRPRDVATLILSELFGADGRSPGPTPQRLFPLAGFQEAGARRAAAILERWGGVLIADGVGLGKTYIALALIEEELHRGGTVAIAVPAALRPVWRGLLGRLGHRDRPRVRLLSHAQLSRGSYPPALRGAVGLTTVDEAHRFRNPATRRHAALAELCRGSRVALITATPINNSPRDLYFLLRLFLRDDAAVHLGVPSLHDLFSRDPLSGPAVRRLMRELMVRRSRRMLGSAAARPARPGEPVRFPRRSPPRVVRFLDPRIRHLAAEIGALELAAYAVHGGGPDATDGVAALVRLGLLKRLESGAYALGRSVGRQLGFLLAFVAALEAGRLLGPGGSAPARHGADMDPLQLVLVDLVTEPCPPGLDTPRLLAAVHRDIARLRRVQRLLRAPDPKLAALRDLIASLTPDKCLVFTEFRDTAASIWRALAPLAPIARIDGAGAWLGLRPAGRGAIVQRFAPRSNGAPEPPVRERVRVLVATDVLAEGMNLQDARHVISYDLPWNPVRLMQRIGRVDRLGSPHDEVVPHLFLPVVGLEEILGLTRRLRRKLDGIAAAIGDEESLQLLERLGQGSAAAAEALSRIDAGEDDPMEILRLRWEELGASNGPAPCVRATSDPAGADGWQPASVARTGSTPESDVRAVALVRSATRPWLMEVGADGKVRDAGFPAVHILTRALQAPDEGQDRAVPIARTEVEHVVGLLRAHFRVIGAIEQAPLPVRAAEPAARLARRLRAALAGPIGALEPDLVPRAERVLQRLDRPLPAGTAARARRLIRGLGEEPSPAAILDLIEEMLCSVGDGMAAPGESAFQAGERGPTAILALLLAGPPERPGL